MHQQPRGSQRKVSPATEPQTNPARTNNPREEMAPGSRPRAGSGMSARDGGVGSPTVADAPGLGPTSDSVKKLDQIVQNFHQKCAALVLHSRMNLQPIFNVRGSGNKKISKWFNIATDEFDDFREELRTWKSAGSFENRPPPMIIETYLDTSRLTSSQCLVIVDENGKRWDVMEALNSSDSSDGGSSNLPRRNAEVILERWRIELKGYPTEGQDDFGHTLPNIYKKGIVFFRSLFVLTRVLPAWKFFQKAKDKGVHPALVPRCRIRTGEPEIQGLDRLRHPLFDGRGEAVTDYVIGDLEIPAGRFYASVTYRNECNFRVDDSESLLSSRFMGVDENFFRPSLPQRGDGSRRDSLAEVGSLPSHRQGKNIGELHQTYGSLSTFHGDGPLGTSPISALKAIRPIGSDTDSPPESAPASVEPDPPHSLPIHGYTAGSRPSLKSFEGMARRPSVSFQPFKAGSLSGSPVTRVHDSESPASPQSTSRTAGLAALTQARNRTSLTAGMPASLRNIPGSVDTSGAASPRPTPGSRYSSSFTHRRGRPSFGGASRADDEQGSSGRQSLASSVAQPGSGLLTEQGAGGSSGSFQTDDDNISEFLKVLESKKTLRSFEAPKRGESATNRTIAQLSRFHQMRDSNNALTDSMASSLHMPPSSGSSSHQLSGVPGMLQPVSMSASSSLGKPTSPPTPHTLHTPAIPSRLSENSIIDHNPTQVRPGTMASGGPAMLPSSMSRENTITQDGTTPMDIPLSPRLGVPSHGRRSSSAAQQNRSGMDDDDADLAYGAQHSLSLGADDREPPTMSMLLNQQMEVESPAQEDPPALQPAAEIRSTGSVDVGRQESERNRPSANYLSAAPSTSPYGRRHYTGMMSASSGRGQPSRHSSRMGGAAARYPRGDNDDGLDGELLLFDMSEVDARSRRSLEEGRGGKGASSGSAGDRAGFESRGTSRRGWKDEL